jgi:hypothetical protein
MSNLNFIIQSPMVKIYEGVVRKFGTECVNKPLYRSSPRHNPAVLNGLLQGLLYLSAKVLMYFGGESFVIKFSTRKRYLPNVLLVSLWRQRSWFRFAMRSLDISVCVMLPAALSLWGRLSLKQEWVPGVLLEVKGARSIKLTASPPSVSWLSRKFENLDIWEPYGSPRHVKGTYLPEEWHDSWSVSIFLVWGRNNH